MLPLRRCKLKCDFDVAIVGAGFGGSLMAMIAHQLGLSVVLLEQGRHPRMTIGESTTPLSNLLLERLSTRYDLPRIAPLAKWGTWQRTYPQIACGLKRGFTFFHREGQLLVAASPHDDIADTHWYRADVDHFLVKEAQRLGVEYRDGARIEILEFDEDGATIIGRAGEEEFHFRARLVIDATGPRGFLHRTLRLEESPLPGLPATESLYSHFTGVGRSEIIGDAVPYPVDDAAVHHVFEGGWVWVLRFNNGVTSAGIAATQRVAKEMALSEGEPAWRRVLDRLPELKSQFKQASVCQPFRYMPAISFRSRTMAGKRWAMLPSAAGFADPLLSTGFALTLMGIERLAQILHSPDVGAQLQVYAQETDDDLLSASRLIAALYATMGDFRTFTAVSLLYFAAVSFAETAHRLGKPELAPGFLLHRHPSFGPASRVLLERAYKPDTSFAADVQRVIEPFNVGGFGDPARHNRYAVRAGDLLDARHKLGASEEEIISMLETSGFCGSLRETAEPALSLSKGPSTPLRSGRDDKFVGGSSISR
jgi:tetracycline 7-halogenase / FADH2 O2-dependent halogenase